MKLYVVYKAVCIVNQRVHFGVHLTSDPYFGTPFASDEFLPNNAELVADLRRYGRSAFAIESLQAFGSYQDAANLLQSLQPTKTYRHGNEEAQKGNKNALGYVPSEATKQKLSEALRGEKNPFFDRRHNEQTIAELSEFRSQMKWIHKDREEKQIIKGEEIPEGWTLGRAPSTRKRLKNKAKKQEENQSVTSD